jgi:hypothetical protein
MTEQPHATYAGSRYAWDVEKHTLTITNIHTKSPELIAQNLVDLNNRNGSFREWMESFSPEQKGRLDAALASKDLLKIYEIFRALAFESDVSIKYGNS